MKILVRALRAMSLLCLCAALPLGAQAPATIGGVVLDPSGAAIPHASVHLQSGDVSRDLATDAVGHFSVSVAAGRYDLTVDAPNFRTYSRSGIELTGGRNPPLTIKLEIAAAPDEITVPSEPALSTDASSNRSALVFKGEQLDTFSDDPASMQQQLSAMAGTDPSTPAQIYVDGFSNGTMPSKESIREVRINQNPFTAQYDQFGNGRIEVFTKPGANKLHGGLETNFGNSTLNARNPYAPAEPPYTNSYITGNVNGPIGKNGSFFLSGQRSDLSANAIVNAVTLDANLNPVTVSQAVANQTVSQTFSGRFDRQFGAKDTFIGRYTWNDISQPDLGVGLFVLASEGSSSDILSQTLQLSDTHLFGPNVVLDSGLQYIRTRTRQTPVSSDPSLIVDGAFSGGGSPSQILRDSLDRVELQQYFSIAHGKHFIRTGLRYRALRDANLSTAGTKGQYVFADLDTYRRAQLDLRASPSLTGAEIAALGDGPSQFSLSAGTPSAALYTGDLGIYGEDEWKATPNLTFDYGLRIESQSAIPDHFDVAPRVGFAYAIKPHKTAKDPVVVVRGGFGIFYQRFASTDLLHSIRQNGITEQVYYIQNPTFYQSDTTIPSASSLTATPPTVYGINPHLRSPMQMQGLVTAEHSFGKLGSVAVNYFGRHSVHQFESLNINAPLPNTGVRPLGTPQDVYQYSSDGIGNGHTFAANVNINATKRFMLWAFAATGDQEADTSGADTFPTNSYNLAADAGPLPAYSKHQLYSGINAHPGWDTALNVFFSARSSSTFNITTGQDNNGDSIYNDRPAFATDLSRSSVVSTAYGTFDVDPLPGQTIIPIDYGRAPSFVYLELYANKNFRFGPRTVVVAPPGAHDAPAAGKHAELPPPRYRLQLGIGADNLLNHVNPGPPVGVLSSSLFGKSVSLSAPFSNNTAANRAVTLRAAFFF